MQKSQSTAPVSSSSVTLATVDDMRQRIRSKSKLKGRQTDDASLAAVRALLGAAPHRRDLLIEHLHVLNDHFGALHDHHLVALAKEMNIPMAEVYEVATFYHHFEVIRGEATAPGLTVRVCDGLSCELAGAQDLLARLPQILGRDDVRVIAAPCIGRCEQAPAVVVHQHPVPFATLQAVAQVVNASLHSHPKASDHAQFDAAALAEQSVSPWSDVHTAPAYVGLDAYVAQGGYALLKDVAAGASIPTHASKPWKTRACAAWAARAFRPAANGASCVSSQRPS